MNEERLSHLALSAIRKSMPMDSWSGFADIIAEARRIRQPDLASPHPDESWFALLEELRRNGFAKLPMTLPPEAIAALRTYFDANPVHRGPYVFSFDGRPKSMAAAGADFQMACYRFDQVVRAPHLVDTFNAPRLIDLIEAYMGCVPTLYSLNGWWSFPANRPELTYSQHFHRDVDDWRFVTLFLFLTHVNEMSGPHQIITGSHTREGMQKVVAKARAAGHDVSNDDLEESFRFPDNFTEEFSGKCESVFKESIFDATGPAGTMWLVNTMALHRGLVPLTRGRLIVWARYGFGPSVNSADLEQGPISRRLVPTRVADTPRNRFVNRLLFDFDRGPLDY
jgi:hypothetical protein